MAPAAMSTFFNVILHSKITRILAYYCIGGNRACEFLSKKTLVSFSWPENEQVSGYLNLVIELSIFQSNYELHFLAVEEMFL